VGMGVECACLRFFDANGWEKRLYAEILK